MQNSKLIEILSHFNPEELTQFDRFVRSPFFYEDDNFQDVIRLFEHVRDCLVQQELEGLDKEIVYVHVFPNTDFIVGKLNKLMSRLMKIVKKYIIYQYSDTNGTKVQKLLAQAAFYLDKRMDKRFQDTIRQLRTIQGNTLRPGKEFFLYQYFIESLVSDFIGLNNNRKGDINLVATIKSLDLHYIVNKLHYTEALLWQNTDVNLDIDQNLILIEEIDRLLSESPHLQIPIIIIYRQAILLLRNEDENDDAPFYKLKELLSNHKDDLPINNLQGLQAVARNYCILRYNKGSMKYLREVVELYKEHLEQGYLYYEGKLVPNTIFNIVQAALRVEQYDWTRSFIESHKDRIIGTQFPEEVYRFNMAIYYFHVRAFQDALDLLSDQYEDTYYNIAARRLEIKIYYEEQSSLLDSKMDAFKVFIFRISKKLLSKVHKTSNNNFINYLRQINNPKTMKNLRRIEKLYAKIKEEKTVSEKSWLLEKLDQLR